MRREHFRIIIGVAVIAVHALCFAVIMFFKEDALTDQQRLDVALLFVPITAAYVVAIVRSAIEEQATPGQTNRVNLNYCIIVSLFTGLALAGLLWTVTQLSGDL